MAEEGAPPPPPPNQPRAAGGVEVPSNLSLLHFLRRQDLSDCGVRLPGEGGEVVPCHKLALCSASGFFYRRFLGTDASADSGDATEGSSSSVDLPPLPDDEELRSRIDVAALFPLVLRFIYAGQQWDSISEQVTAENAMGLFALGELLEIATLAKHAFEYIEAEALGPDTVARLLYVAVRLGGDGSSGSGFAAAQERCTEVLKGSFGEVASKSEDCDLLCKLPIPVLAPLLEADELEVSAEAVVLDVAQRVLRSRKREEAPPPPEAPAAEEGGEEAAPAPEAAAAAEGGGFAAPLTEEEAQRILGAVRFPHLEHRELLEAVKDPVLLEAGAQQRILEALSSRLDAYEHAGEGRSGERQEPRPSTIRKPHDAADDAASSPPPPVPGIDGFRPAGNGASPPKRSAPPTPGPAEQMAATMGGGGAMARSQSGIRRGGGGIAGHPLFPCITCGAGSLVLRQRDLRWCVECSRYPTCQHSLMLPSCVMAAAVDGHCASCTLRLGADVRTLTIRLGHQHAAALLRLPGGVDTLRGMCVAGCTNTLEMLGD